jgi:hypothetical protein
VVADGIYVAAQTMIHVQFLLSRWQRNEILPICIGGARKNPHV